MIKFTESKIDCVSKKLVIFFIFNFELTTLLFNWLGISSAEHTLFYEKIKGLDNSVINYIKRPKYLKLHHKFKLYFTL